MTPQFELWGSSVSPQPLRFFWPLPPNAQNLTGWKEQKLADPALERATQVEAGVLILLMFRTPISHSPNALTAYLLVFTVLGFSKFNYKAFENSRLSVT